MKSPKIKSVKAWAVKSRFSRLYPDNWGIYIATFRTKKDAQAYQGRYVSIGAESKIIPVLISPLTKKK